MRITDADVCRAAVLETQTKADEFLKGCTTEAGFGAIASLLSHGRDTATLTEAEREKHLWEIHLQAQAIYIGLAPIWFRIGRTLPRVDKEDIQQVFAQSRGRQWTEAAVYNSITAANGLWGEMINTYRENFTELGSSLYVAAVLQAFMNKLEPLEVVGTDAVSDQREWLLDAKEVEPDISASVEKQLKDILGEN